MSRYTVYGISKIYISFSNCLTAHFPIIFQAETINIKILLLCSWEICAINVMVHLNYLKDKFYASFVVVCNYTSKHVPSKFLFKLHMYG